MLFDVAISLPYQIANVAKFPYSPQSKNLGELTVLFRPQKTFDDHGIWTYTVKVIEF